MLNSSVFKGITSDTYIITSSLNVNSFIYNIKVLCKYNFKFLDLDLRKGGARCTYC